MPLLETLPGGKTLSLLRADVDESRSTELAHRVERLDHRSDVMTIDGTEISESQLLEEHPRREQRLHALFPAPYPRSDAHRRKQSARPVVGDVADGRPHPIVE